MGNTPQENHSEATSFNPILEAINAVLNGEAPAVLLVMTNEEREGRRATLANPGLPSEKILAALAARRSLGRRTNEI